MPSQFKVALVAAARNEAAYLPDWIFHHLHFGFGPIDVYVNRSEDTSAEVVRRIAGHYSEVRLRDGDLLEQARANVQIAAYRQARKRAAKELSRKDYVLFADIDEFWTPADFQSPVQKVLSGAGCPRIAAFNWFQLLSDGAPFAPSFAPSLYGMHHHLVKTALRAQLPVWRQSVHTVRTFLPVRRWSASGGSFAQGAPFRTASAPQTFGAAFMLHRLFRSEIEYLAILGRGRPAFRDKIFKDNRFGYRLIEGVQQPLQAFHVGSDRLKAYEAARQVFLQETGVSGLVAQAQDGVRHKAAQVLQRYLELPQADRVAYECAFRNLDLQHLSQKLLHA